MVLWCRFTVVRQMQTAGVLPGAALPLGPAQQFSGASWQNFLAWLVPIAGPIGYRTTTAAAVFFTAVPVTLTLFGCHNQLAWQLLGRAELPSLMLIVLRRQLPELTAAGELAAAAVPAPAAAQLVRQCAVCGAASRPAGKRLLKCARCRAVRYCSGACQKKDWPTHKQQCSRARAEGGPT